MNSNTQIKVEKEAILLENDVYLYKIPSGTHPGHCHKANDWDISNPVGVYKLILLADDGDSCQIQLKDDNGDFFGYGVIDCYPEPLGSTSSSSITPVADSSRYFTTKIRKLSSGQDELIGIGFISRDDSSSLTKTLESYFTSRKQSDVSIDTAADSPATTPHDKVPSELFQGKTFKYNCQLCSNGFDTTHLLKEHIEIHHKLEAPQILFYCDAEDCDKRFFSQLTLDNHKRMEHIIKDSPPTKRIKCGNDQDQDQDREGNAGTWNIIQDKLQDNPNGAPYHNALKTKFWCPICPSETFTTCNENELKEHMKKRYLHGNLIPTTCDYCSLIFNNRERFVRHTYLVHYKCSTCYWFFMDEVSLKDHAWKSHKQLLNYKCHLCLKHFTVRQLFIEHYKTEHPDPAVDSRLEQSNLENSPSPSPKTVKGEDDQQGRAEKEEECQNTRMDNQAHTPNGAVFYDKFKTKFWCPICPSRTFTFMERNDLIKHLKRRNFHEEMPRICYICSLMFKSEVLWLDHAHLLHFACQMCRLEFKTVDDLSHHVLRIHQKTVTFQCHRCPSNFTCHNLFIKHLKMEHTLDNQKIESEGRPEELMEVEKVKEIEKRIKCEADGNGDLEKQQESWKITMDLVADNPTGAVYHKEDKNTVENHKRKQDEDEVNLFHTKRIKCEDEQKSDSDILNDDDDDDDNLVENPNGAMYHNEDKTLFWCPICPSKSYTTANKEEATNHIRNKYIHGMVKPKICIICSLVFNNLERFMNHANISHYTCSICFFPFVDEDRLRVHVLKVHKEPRFNYQCHLCPSNFNNHQLFVEHLKTEHLHPVVDVREEQSETDLQHQNSPHGQDELIGIGFTSREDSLNLTRALGSHLPSKKRSSVLTDNTTESPAPAPSPVVHDEYEVPSNLCKGKIFRNNCQFCPNGFDKPQLLKEHIEKSHGSNAPSVLFYCDVQDCSKRFFSQLTLNNHKKMEHPDKTSIGNLLLVDIPNGSVFQDEHKKLFWCPICPSKTFTTNVRKELNKHLKQRYLHGGEKLRICDICSLLFKSQESFMDHANLLHFTCSVCKTPFETGDKLGRHILKMHQETLITYECHRCKSNFTAHNLFVKHFKTEHTLDNQSRAERPEEFIEVEKVKEIEKRIVCEAVKQQEWNIRMDLLADNPNGAVYTNEDKTLFWCPICPLQKFTFPHEKPLMIHMRKKDFHGSLTPRACKHCSLMFNTVERYVHHKNLEHFMCSHCSAEFTNEDKLRQHFSRCHQGPLRYKCHLCSTLFALRNLLVQHYTKEHPLPPADPRREQPKLTPLPSKKEKCVEKLSRAEKKREREIIVEGLVDIPNGAVYHDELKTVFWCPICPSQSFTTLTKKGLFKHLKDKTIHGLENYKVCAVCCLLFSKMEDFQYHASIFHYACPTCFCTVPNEDRLKNHVQEKHKETFKYKCHLCPNSFAERELFLQHFKMEHPRPSLSQLQLTLKNYKTMEPKQLENPSPTIGIKIKCEGDQNLEEKEEGDNSQVDDSNPNSNGAVYHDELKTTFWCPICPSKTFTTTDKIALFKHLTYRENHGPGQPRICGICSLVFNNVESFLDHANLFHFTCSVCMISFKDDEEKLRLHVLRSHKQKLNYPCHRCLSSFTDHELFVEHLKTEHDPHPKLNPGGEESGIDQIPLSEDAPVSQPTLDGHGHETKENPENPQPIQRIKCEDTDDSVA